MMSSMPRYGYRLDRPGEIIRNILWRFPRNASGRDHVFLMGAPRSGTTLLQTILSAHTKIAGSERESGIFTSQNLFNTERHYCDLTSSEVEEIIAGSSDIVEFFDGVAGKVRECTGGERFLEKTPQHILKIARLVRYFPNSQFICVYRDGRDCYCSARHHKGVPQGGNVARYARYWRDCIKAQLSVAAKSNVLQISYEELTSAPRETLSRIAGFLGLELEAGQLDPAVYSRDRRSGMPEFSKLNQPINGTSQQRWKTEMSREELRVFSRIAGAQLSQLGYEKS